MIQLNPEFFNKNGKEYVLLPYEEFVKIEELLEDLEDLQDLRTIRQEERDSHSVYLDDVKQMFDI